MLSEIHVGGMGFCEVMPNPKLDGERNVAQQGRVEEA